LNAIDERSPIISKEHQNKRGFEFAVRNGYLSAQIYKDNNNFSRIENTGTRLEANQWYHVAMSYEHVGDRTSALRLFVNGREDASLLNAVGPVNASDAPLRVGAYIWNNTFQRYFNGLIDELFVFNTALTPEQITGLMTLEVPPLRAAYQSNQGNIFELFPNPATNHVTIGYNLIQASHTELSIYDMKGTLRLVPVQGFQEAGSHEVSFNVSELPAGVYLARISSNSGSNYSKFIVTK